MFKKQTVLRLFLPVFVETMSVTLLGMVSGVMVSSVGEEAMSAVSIVETFNAVVMNLFIAIATGVTVKVSQYIGNSRPVDARRVAEQSIFLSVLFSGVLGLAIILFGKQILALLFAGAADGIRTQANSYLIACAASYASYALFTTCNSVFRGVGDYKITLFSGIFINLLHAAGSALLIFVCRLGVLGVGLSLVFCRTVCGLMNYAILRRGTNKIRIGSMFQRLQWKIVRAVLFISVPAAIDSAVFNGGRLLVQIFIAQGGTVALAANAVANGVTGLMQIPANAVSVLAVTIAGQHFGAHDLRATRRSIWNTTLFSSALELLACGCVFLFLDPIIGLYQPTAEVAAQTKDLLLLMIATIPPLWSFAFVMPAGLRATGDVKYTTTVSVTSMWVIRVFCAWLLAVQLGMGVMGVWYAMVLDWVVRAAFYIGRTCSHRWERLDRI